mgnify:FL=1
MKKIRAHDSLYIKFNRYKKPKEANKLLVKILKKRLSIDKEYKLIDIGCANGELLYFLNEKFSNLKFCGSDVRGDLLNLAKKKLPSNINLKKVDYNKKLNSKQKFDVIVCSGVISIFDNLDIFFKNIKQNMKKNSLLFIFSSFNEYDFDILISYKDLNSKLNNYQSGWNIWSIKKIKSYFKEKKIIKHPFNIKLNIKKNKKDLIRSWTINVNQKKYFTNALMTIQNQMWLEIK